MFELTVPAGGEAAGYGWLAVSRTLKELTELNELAQRAPGALLDRTGRYWRFWLHRARRDFGDLSPAVAGLYRRSLLIIRTQIDNNGAIVAANDSDITAFGKDHYSYIWPRDAALVAMTLDLAGYHEAPHRFYVFLRKLLAQTIYEFGGYLLHRYTPDGLIAASWHPTVGQGRLLLPIQEDGTALVVYGLCQHLIQTGNAELFRDLYWDFVRPAADFLLVFRDPFTGLPRPSHDLWEEQHGIFLFTCSTVHAALVAAAGLAEALGEPDQAAEYRNGAEEIRMGVAEHFFDPTLNRLVFMLHVEQDGALRRDPRLDSSMAGVFAFELFPADDLRVVNTMAAYQEGLENRLPVGGMARHSDDYYHHTSGNYQEYPGNPWFISTLWLADWLTATGDRKGARQWLEWCAKHALPSGVLAEQLHPYTGEPLSVSPLTWSHAAFIASVEHYLQT
jgi:GH15 family glucan-1,4-alpha-glucosidase